MPAIGKTAVFVRFCDECSRMMFSSLFAFLSHTRVWRLSIHAIRRRAHSLVCRRLFIRI